MIRLILKNHDPAAKTGTNADALNGKGLGREVNKQASEQTLFVRGFIFGSRAERGPTFQDLKPIAALDRRKKKPNGWNTAVGKYAELIYSPKVLESKILDVIARDGKILDVGLGSGIQWLDFCEKHGLDIQKVNLSATSLTDTFHPILKEYGKDVVISDAASLHERFDAGSFDLILSNGSLSRQELSGIENIAHLVKSGGEAIITAKGPMSYEVLIQPLANSNYCELVNYTIPTINDIAPSWSIHIRKS